MMMHDNDCAYHCLHNLLFYVGTPQTDSIYLGDVGIPKGVFSAAGVKYVSPFTDKIVIPLNDR